MEEELLRKYYSIGKATSVRKAIHKFTQGTSETFHEAWEWRDETTRSSISHGLVSKIKPNLPIWGIKRELRGIMVNKGRIHREFRYFWDIF